MAGMFRCKHPFSFDVDGVSRVVSAGDVVSTADPAFKDRQELFEPLEPYLNRRAGIEQATADPGEKRSVQVPAPMPEPEPGPVAPVRQPTETETARRAPRRKTGDKS